MEEENGTQGLIDSGGETQAENPPQESPSTYIVVGSKEETQSIAAQTSVVPNQEMLDSMLSRLAGTDRRKEHLEPIEVGLLYQAELKRNRKRRVRILASLAVLCLSLSGCAVRRVGERPGEAFWKNCQELLQARRQREQKFVCSDVHGRKWDVFVRSHL
jgi:hypothetical protein